MKILWLTNVPSPYRVDFFNEFGRYCDLTVIFEKNTSDERDKSWLNYQIKNFTSIFLKGRSINSDSAFCLSILKYIRNSVYDYIVVTNVSSPTGILAIIFLRAKRIPYWIEGDGGFAKNGNGIKEKLKRYLISGANGYFSTCKTHDEYYMNYGADPQKIYRYPFTSIMKKDLINANLLTSDEKLKIRMKLGLNVYDHCILYILSNQKCNIEKELTLLKRMSNVLGDKYGFFYLYSDSFTDEPYNIATKTPIFDLRNDKEILNENSSLFFAAIDGLVFLTKDNVISYIYNKAMVFGVPIIKSSSCISKETLFSNELTYNTIDELIGIIKHISNSNIQTKISYSTLEVVLDYPVERMVNNFFDIMIKEKNSIIRSLAKQNLGIDCNQKVILFVGQMIYRKGIDILFHIANEICNKREDCSFIIVGGNVPQEYSNLYSLIPSNRIKVIPYLIKDELQLYYRAADVFFFPTREDIWGLVINEALAHRLPVITSIYCGAGKELIEDSINGYLTSLDSDKEILDELSNVLDNSNSYCWGSYLIAKDYTIEKMVRRHIEIFNNLSKINE